MRRIAAAVAAIALISGAAHAQGQGGGQDKNRGGGNSAEAGQQGGGNRGGGNADRGNRGQDNGPSMAQSARGSDQRGKSDRGNSNAQRSERGSGNARQVERAARDNRGRGNDDRRDVVRVTGLGSIAPRGLIDGCPPGLAKKNPPCVPPGQARNDERSLFGWDRPDFWGMSLGDGRYMYDDGYLMRFGPDGRIGGYLPLLGGALGIGNSWPSYYDQVALPGYYENYYGLGRYDSYRYADNVIYRVDPETSAITSIAALLTGDDFTIGQPMPLGYDVYNVPYGYRDRYADGPDANYRYSDGRVYQVDPTTQLIAAAIELVT